MRVSVPWSAPSTSLLEAARQRRPVDLRQNVLISISKIKSKYKWCMSKYIVSPLGHMANVNKCKLLLSVFLIDKLHFFFPQWIKSVILVIKGTTQNTVTFKKAWWDMSQWCVILYTNITNRKACVLFKRGPARTWNKETVFTFLSCSSSRVYLLSWPN